MDGQLAVTHGGAAGSPDRSAVGADLRDAVWA
jgi:hypothetical protein